MLSLTLERVQVRYADLPVPALDLPALHLDAGEQVALVGPSGSGKTTLINIITGMERADTGRIIWSGQDIAALREGGRDRWRARNVGLVMQDFHLFPGLSALANVLLPQRLSHLRLPSGMAERAQQLLERVSIERHDQLVGTMSRGQMQRVAVARALVGKPGLIVADEPTASLDAKAGEAVAGLLIELATEAGATLIVASHDQRLVGRMKRRLSLENGCLAA